MMASLETTNKGLENLANDAVKGALQNIVNNYTEQWQYKLGVECIDKYITSKRMNIIDDVCLVMPDVPNINYLTSYLSFIQLSDEVLDFFKLRDIVMTYHSNVKEGVESRNVQFPFTYVTDDVAYYIRDLLNSKLA